MTRVRLTITQDDIDRGTPQSGRLCAAAIALRRSLKLCGQDLVNVTRRQIAIRRGIEYPTSYYRNSLGLTRFILDTDDGAYGHRYDKPGVFYITREE